MKRIFIYVLIGFAILLLLKKLKTAGAKSKKRTTDKFKFKGMEAKKFIEFMKPSAIAIEKKTGIPYKFIVSQIALETGWGKSPLFYQYYNVGGIRSFKPESEPHGLYWTWEHVQPSDLPKWDKYERDKAQDVKLENGKIKIRVKLPFRHFTSLVEGLDFYVKKVLLNKYFKGYITEAKGNAIDYVKLLQSKKTGVVYATDSNYIPKITSIINQIS